MLDFPATQPEEQLRNLIAETIGLFIDAHVSYQQIALDNLNQYLISHNPLIALFERK